MLHKPTRGFGTEEDTDTEEEGRDEGRPELETPGDTTGVFDDYVGGEAQEDSCDC